MANLIEALKNISLAVGLFVIFELLLMISIILFCVIREMVRRKKE